MAIAARPRVGVCCVLGGSLDTPLHAYVGSSDRIRCMFLTILRVFFGCTLVCCDLFPINLLRDWGFFFLVSVCVCVCVCVVHSAVVNGQFVVVKWLVSAGADCNARNASGATPLHRCAVAASHVAEMAVLLVGAGADPFVRNGSGLLAADLTTSLTTRALLLDAGRLPAVRLRVPRDLVSKIVGKGGERLQTLQHRTVTVIKLPARDSLSDEIFVRGLADGIAAVKEFFINGIISDGKSLTNVHDVRSPQLPVSVRAASPLMLTAPEPLPTHKRSSSTGCDPFVVSPLALEIRAGSEPRLKDTLSVGTKDQR
jgi:hypothetical protein